ncbi:MAG: hypothetical protein LUC26_02740 [Prevotella sp.]|nr:hypothetical protein [Prevotella sp.]
MKGVIDDRYVSALVDDYDNAMKQLNDLKKMIVESFHLESVDESRWEEKKREFLDIVNKIPSNF